MASLDNAELRPLCFNPLSFKEKCHETYCNPMRFALYVPTVELCLFISFCKEIPVNIKIFLAVLAILGSLVSCAHLNPHPMDMTSAIRRNAKTSADHEALAKHYDDSAQEMRLKAQEHKQRLEEYEKHSYLYGKRAQDLKAHCQSLIISYEQAAKSNKAMADIHREMAAAAR